MSTSLLNGFSEDVVKIVNAQMLKWMDYFVKNIWNRKMGITNWMNETNDQGKWRENVNQATIQRNNFLTWFLAAF